MEKDREAAEKVEPSSDLRNMCEGVINGFI